jgi:site-specific DNA-methyltransferase (adenine-specific)
MENWLLGNWKDHYHILEDKSISLLLTDPPYIKVAKVNGRFNFEKSTWQACREVNMLLSLINLKLAQNAHIFMFGTWDNYHNLSILFDLYGISKKKVIVWVKQNSKKEIIGDSLNTKYEIIVYGTIGKPDCYSRIPDVIVEQKPKNKFHPYEKPVNLLSKLITATTCESDLIFDPFGGGASTLVAAKMLNRNFIGCEKKRKYYDIGKDRLFHIENN